MTKNERRRLPPPSAAYRMASISLASGPTGAGSIASSSASTKAFASASAVSTGTETAAFMRSGEIHRLGGTRTAGAMHDLLETALGGLQFGFAMCLERLAAFVEDDGVLQIDLALLQTADDGLQLLEGGLETQRFDRGGGNFRFGLGGHCHASISARTCAAA